MHKSLALPGCKSEEEEMLVSQTPIVLYAVNSKQGAGSRTHVCRQIAQDGAEDGAECCTEGTHIVDLQRVVVGEKARKVE